MSVIKILPEILSNQIAAGEVVERPASVVKELVENALDAGSSRVLVEIEQGGRALIRVSDNGCGMNPDDALLCLERYATSKLHKRQDLFRIRTLGFRGEAIPSIASVSRFVLVSRHSDEEMGTRIEIDGGKIKKVTAVGAPVGTMITVRQLFFNTPARRKFLKTVPTESGHIADVLNSMALGWHQVRFTLRHNGKTIKDWPRTTGAAERVVAILGRETRSGLYPLSATTPQVQLKGWIVTPRITRSTARGIYTYVNGRFVRERVVQHAIMAGYSGRLMKQAYPLAVLYLKVPFDKIDVNVHPTKSQVRFAEQRRVHARIVAAVADTLNSAERSEWQSATRSTVETAPWQLREKPATYGQKRWTKPDAGRLAARSDGMVAPPGLKTDLPPQSPTAASSADALGREPNMPDPQTAATQTDPVQQWERLRFIGQLHATYLLCETESGLVLVDQHAAHERILFEQLRRRANSQPRLGQQLLIPETIELNHSENDALNRLLPSLRAVGFEIEPFGGNTFVIKSVPAALAEREVRALVFEMVEKTLEMGVDASLDDTMEACLKIMACHGSIRAKQRMNAAEIKALLDQLAACENPAHCPHGRPTWMYWSVKHLEKSFGRVT